MSTFIWGNSSPLAHHEVDVEKEEDVVADEDHTEYAESEVVCRVSQIADVLEERHDGVPNAHRAQQGHRRQDVLVLRVARKQ